MQELVRYIVCSKFFSRTSFCQKLCAELLCRSLQMCKAGIVAQHIVCLRGEGAFRCLGVQAAGGHLGRDAVPGHDAGHTGLKRCRDHAQAVTLGLRRSPHDDRAIQHEQRCTGILCCLLCRTDAAHDLRVGQAVQRRLAFRGGKGAVSKISRLIWSASASGTPWAENTAVTVDLPQPLRPVMPSAIIA